MKLRMVPDVETLKGKVVLMRIDLNVPDLTNKEDLRIARILPEIAKYSEAGTKLVLIAHKGRPKGEDASLSLQPFLTSIKTVVKKNVSFGDHEIHVANYESAIDEMSEGDVLLLENIRFYKEEKANHEGFSRQLAELGDIYVNNAFSVAHRDHASITGISAFVDAYAGALLMEEIDLLDRDFEEPVMLVLGGIKWETKLPLLEAMADRTAAVLLGSGYVELLQSSKDKGVKKIIDLYEERLASPFDVYLLRGGRKVHVHILDIEEGDEVLDVGPETMKLYDEVLHGAKTVIWNGPIGQVELRKGEIGTIQLVDSLASIPAEVIAGGGDSLAFLEKIQRLSDLSSLSLGGGAMLAFLSKASMPGLEVLQET